METTAKFSVNIVGETTGKPFFGSFTVKTVLTRGDRFIADQRRRELLGPNSQDALPDLQLEAFMHGQLMVRVVESPEWWRQSDYGRNIEDANVIVELFNLVREKEDQAKEDLKKSAEEALTKISKSK
jgi:hypothetical protein